MPSPKIGSSAAWCSTCSRISPEYRSRSADKLSSNFVFDIRLCVSAYGEMRRLSTGALGSDREFAAVDHFFRAEFDAEMHLAHRSSEDNFLVIPIYGQS